MTDSTVGVVGAGVMGAGVAQSLATAGHRVILVDIDQAALERAKSDIRQGLRMQSMFQKGGDKPKESSSAILERVHTTGYYQELEAADFLIENVVEKWPVKQEVYGQIDAICPPECVFAVNTSCISITKVGSITQRPDKIIGTHFMNPVPMKPVVEVIRGHHTSDETIERTQALLATMGKEGIVVQDLPGFVSNRVLMLTINEAIWVVMDQVSPAEDVDRLFKTCFGHKMGPLETGDLIGLDTILDSLVVLHESYGDDKFRPCPLLVKMVDAGLLGRKSGKGFYDYGVQI
ncbi:MAG: 3-hydroxyacyl-CoA dehydrogenase NAD-binding domain-containing protein [Acidobacteriota bacterium]|nr:3-hydroxyacyl-CoA dehydrogenase NAD-binding domain-containing protein [Acidobacteriota bacterium]